MSFIHTASEKEKQTVQEKKEAVHKEELISERGRAGCGGTVAEIKSPLLQKIEATNVGCLPSSAWAQQGATAQFFSAASSERPPALPHTIEKCPVIPTSQKKTHSNPPN